MQIFPTRMCNVTAWRHSRLRAHWLMALVGGGGWGKSMYSAFLGNSSVPYLSFVYGRSLWAELNGGENSLHWKANMLPLIVWLCAETVMRLYFYYFKLLRICSLFQNDKCSTRNILPEIVLSIFFWKIIDIISVNGTEDTCYQHEETKLYPW